MFRRVENMPDAVKSQSPSYPQLYLQLQVWNYAPSSQAAPLSSAAFGSKGPHMCSLSKALWCCTVTDTELNSSLFKKAVIKAEL